MKTLESSIADRINALTTAKPADRDAFINHLTILDRAEDLNDHDNTLHAAVLRTATEFQLLGEAIASRVIGKLEPIGKRHAA